MAADARASELTDSSAVARDDSAAVPISILVVDDEAPIRQMMAAVFQAEGHRVRSAADGEAALLAVAESLPDVVILDLTLPGLSGAEVLRQLRTDGVNVAVIVVSAALHGASMAATAGADAYLAKPFDLDELVSEVMRLAGRRLPSDCTGHGRPDPA